MRLLHLALVALVIPLVMLVFRAVADTPKNYSGSERYSRDGEDSWGYSQNIGTSAETFMSGVAAQTQLVQVPRLFKYGTRVVISCEADTIACWVQDSGATITTGGLVTDAGSTAGRTTGVGGCFKIEANSYRASVSPHVSGSKSDTEDLLSQRIKGCASPTKATNDVTYGTPCDTAASDCDFGTYDDHTCTVSTPVSGNLLRMIAVSSANDCFINVIR